MTARFFATPAAFRRWLESNHESRDELLVGFHKKGSGKPSITWPEAVDEALCFGWIDGVRRSLDDDSYTIRFTPRKERSIWSAVNIARAEELIAEGRMRPAGLRAFERRTENRSQIYSYEQRDEAVLDHAAEREFRANAAAWTFFQSQPPWYRRTAIYWVMTAKKDDTRRRRLATLIDDSAHGRRIKQLARPPKGAVISHASTGSA
ncbi:MAG: hypothetical protein JWM87_823 [Candidatus Eremiobacteraeota bacterium]|nr:hypothetical protein [Candidatus Eremiobacteraeota bacterium]